MLRQSMFVVFSSMIFYILCTKGVMSHEIIPLYGSHDPIDEDIYSPIQPLVTTQKDQTINQCVLIPDSQNNRIYVVPQNNGRDLIARHRRSARNWLHEKPIYIDEPSWVIIDTSQNLFKDTRDGITASEEPFFISRGKRSLKANRHAWTLAQYPRYSNRISPSINARHLSDFLRNNINLSKLAGDDNKLMHSEMRLNYYEPRDKHSDILSVLQEPFFISRGKKSSHVDVINGRNKFNDYDDSSLRDRRGEDFLEQLFKEKDPFYVTRGKKDNHSENVI